VSVSPRGCEDIDNDSEPVTYSVLAEEIEEKTGKPGDAGRCGQSQIALKLAEV
jgi:hypothetical protein